MIVDGKFEIPDRVIMTTAHASISFNKALRYMLDFAFPPDPPVFDVVLVAARRE
ncbi:MAG: hypothetical protein FD180_3618 [Planctomycetota bacterium]|nr:MAG: hypothetical protein FD180_3618 [Planctomycetota bacterium]